MKRTTKVRVRSGSLVATLFGLGLAGGSAYAEDKPVVEKLEHGEINWSDKTVIATGSGAPNTKLPNVAAVRLNAERAAKLDAYRNIMESLKALRVTAEVRGDKQLARPEVRTQVEGIIRGCKTVDTRYYSDGAVDVVLRCPLDGGLGAALAPVQDRKAIDAKGEEAYTGLIIDAVGLGVAPALAPRVVDAAGAELYGPAFVTPTAHRERGTAVYRRSVEEAKADPRVGKNPLVLRASAVGGVASDIQVAEAEASKLSATTRAFLADARVIIATDGLEERAQAGQE